MSDARFTTEQQAKTTSQDDIERIADTARKLVANAKKEMKKYGLHRLKAEIIPERLAVTTAEAVAQQAEDAKAVPSVKQNNFQNLFVPISIQFIDKKTAFFQGYKAGYDKGFIYGRQWATKCYNDSFAQVESKLIEVYSKPYVEKKQSLLKRIAELESQFAEVKNTVADAKQVVDAAKHRDPNDTADVERVFDVAQPYDVDYPGEAFNEAECDDRDGAKDFARLLAEGYAEDVVNYKRLQETDYEESREAYRDGYAKAYGDGFRRIRGFIKAIHDLRPAQIKQQVEEACASQVSTLMVKITKLESQLAVQQQAAVQLSYVWSDDPKNPGVIFANGVYIPFVHIDVATRQRNSVVSQHSPEMLSMPALDQLTLTTEPSVQQVAGAGPGNVFSSYNLFSNGAAVQKSTVQVPAAASAATSKLSSFTP